MLGTHILENGFIYRVMQTITIYNSVFNSLEPNGALTALSCLVGN